MLVQMKRILTDNNGDWWSKLTDGILLALILLLVWMTVFLTIRPINAMFGPPGLLLYVLALMAVSVYTLQQSIISRRPDTQRALFGIAGGFLAWSSVLITSQMGVPIFPNLASLLLLVLMALVVAVLWRSVLPQGVRFFFLTFLMNWVGYIYAGVQEWAVPISPIFALARPVLGVLFCLAILYVLGWILFQSRRRLHRVSGGLILWFLISLVIYAFGGNIF
jgi:hypothetical protein